MAVSRTETPATMQRSVKAATERLATCREADDLHLVDNGKQGDDHDQYRVDLREPACSCPDFQYRADSDDRVAEHGCKHIRRVKMERGDIDIAPLLKTPLDIDPLLLREVER
jgi:hypothetical protein